MSIEDLDKTVNINFRVPRAYREAVNEKAAELGISSSMFYRRCIENFLDEKSPIKITSNPYAAKHGTVIGVGMSKDLRKSFVSYCNTHNYKASEVLRGFVYAIYGTIEHTEPLGIKDTLFYLMVFLQNSMKKQGYVSSLEDIRKTKVRNDAPLIQEVREGKTITFLVTDKEKQITYSIPFHKG